MPSQLIHFAPDKLLDLIKVIEPVSGDVAEQLRELVEPVRAQDRLCREFVNSGVPRTTRAMNDWLDCRGIIFMSTTLRGMLDDRNM